MKVWKYLAFALALVVVSGHAQAGNDPIPGFWELPDSARHDALVEYYQNGPGGQTATQAFVRARDLLSMCNAGGYEEGVAFAKLALLVQHYRLTNADSAEYYRLSIEENHFFHLDCVEQQHFLVISGVHLEYKGETDEAMLRLLNAIEVGEKCHHAVAFAYSTVGGMLRKMERYEESIEYLMKAIALTDLKTNSDTLGLVNTYTHLSLVYSDWGKQDSSFKYAQKALDFDRVPLSLFRVANWYADNGNPDKALDLLYEARDSIRSTEVFHLEGSLNRYLSKCFRLKGENAKAVDCAEKFLAQAVKRGDLAYRQLAYATLVQAFLGKNAHLVDSLRHYDEEMIAVSTQKTTLELERKYQTEKKEKANLALKAELKDQTIAVLQARNWLVIGGISILLLAVLVYLWSVRRRIRTRAKIAALQKQAADLQMNPHFFFNALNSINLFIARNEKDQARLYLEKFSRLMRLTLQNSIQETISLEKELDYLKNYLSLEQLRMKNFDFEIEVPDELLPCRIPAMLIQPLVENSLLHGFKEIGSRGMLKVKVDKEGALLKVEVLDNGRGIQQSRTVGQGTGWQKKSVALDLLVQRMAFFGGAQAGVEMGEGIREGDRPGTRVAFSLPIIN